MSVLGASSFMFYRGKNKNILIYNDSFNKEIIRRQKLFVQIDDGEKISKK